MVLNKRLGKSILHIFFLFGIILFAACNNNSGENKTENSAKDSINIKEESVTYKADTTPLQGYISYNAALDGKRPVVLVIPEWWGLTEYPRMRAHKLAELGYLAMAVDMYGNGKIANDVQEATAYSTPFYSNMEMSNQRIQAAINKIKENPMADTSQIAAIGYCFGGGTLLNYARMGGDLDGIVSFHGSLKGAPVKKDLLTSAILVCHGADDPFVPKSDVDAFRKSMDSINANYTFKSYPGAVHAFTNPNATALGQKFNIPIAYNAAADSASWNDMKDFFGKIFRK